MLSLEEAIIKCEEASPKTDIDGKYRYQDNYYFSIKPKGLSEGVTADTAMVVVDANTGKVEFTNLFALNFEGIVDKLQKL